MDFFFEFAKVGKGGAKAGTWNLFINLSTLTYTKFDCAALLVML